MANGGGRRPIDGRISAHAHSEHESRAPKRGVWLMRGAQPATSAGARLFAGSPIPALFTAPQKGVKKSNLELAVFQICCALSTSESTRYFWPESPRVFRVNVFANSSVNYKR